MEEFPENFDDEFEAMYADELDLLREMEMGKEMQQMTLQEVEKNKVDQSNLEKEVNPDPTSPPQVTSKAESFLNIIKRAEDLIKESDNLGLGAKRALPFSNDGASDFGSRAKKKKISAPLIEGFDFSKGRSVQDNADDILIQRIVSYRKKQLEEMHFEEDLPRDICEKTSHPIKRKETATIHRRLPRGGFQSLTTCSGKRYYLDFLSKETLERQIASVSKQKLSLELLPEPFNIIKRKAERELEKMIIRKSAEDSSPTQQNDVLSASSEAMAAKDDPIDLWVERYKPKSYLDLLSDESTNRTVLNWVKLWDKLVFGRERKKVKKKETPFDKFNKDGKPKFFYKAAPEVITELDDQGKPVQKVILLCGPPGLGKTTLAHIIAKHAGYSIVEMNASDDRSTEVFKTNLENATLMKTVFGNDKLPNCLIIDEIDGAPAPSINLLVKMLSDTKSLAKLSYEGKKSKKKNTVVLKRPVICICNDLYTPALKPLRQIALTVQFPPTYTVRLAQRLQEICCKQSLRADLSLLRALCEKTENDIRSCLSALQFIKSTSGELCLADLEGFSIGQKDYQRSLFSVWNDIFTIPRPKRKYITNPHETKDKEGVLKSEPHTEDHLSPTSSYRFQKIHQSVQSCGEYERLASGWFENYPEAKFKDSNLDTVLEGLEWNAFADIVQKEVYHTQSWILLSYLSFTFVAYHFLFASHQRPKLKFPTQYAEHVNRLGKNQSILATLASEMSPSAIFFSRGSNLVYDVLPYLVQVVQPSLRSVNEKLFSDREKEGLKCVVSTMISYNLTYLQERGPEGQYTFSLDPNVGDIIYFSGVGKRRPFSYSSKQLVAREIELEKLRRAENYFESKEELSSDALQKSDGGQTKEQTEKKTPAPVACPKVEPKKMNFEENPVVKDFFGRVIANAQTSSKPGDGAQGKKDIWFRFKEGYSNAVRRPIKVKEFLF